MNRIYLMPKVLIISFILLYIYETFNFWDILLAIIVSSLFVLLMQILYMFLKGKYYLHCMKKGKVNIDKIYSYINQVLKTVNYFLGLKVTAYHLERFDPKRNYLIIPNHQSNCDVTILLEVIKRPIVFVSKISISKLIIVRDWMKLIGSLYLDKNDMRGQIRIMKK